MRATLIRRALNIERLVIGEQVASADVAWGPIGTASYARDATDWVVPQRGGQFVARYDISRDEWEVAADIPATGYGQWDVRADWTPNYATTQVVSGTDTSRIQINPTVGTPVSLAGWDHTDRMLWPGYLILLKYGASSTEMRSGKNNTTSDNISIVKTIPYPNIGASVVVNNRVYAFIQNSAASVYSTNPNDPATWAPANSMPVGSRWVGAAHLELGTGDGVLIVLGDDGVAMVGTGDYGPAPIPGFGTWTTTRLPGRAAWTRLFTGTGKYGEPLVIAGDEGCNNLAVSRNNEEWLTLVGFTGDVGGYDLRCTNGKFVFSTGNRGIVNADLRYAP